MYTSRVYTWGLLQQSLTIFSWQYLTSHDSYLKFGFGDTRELLSFEYTSLFSHFNVTFNIDLNKISIYFYPREILAIGKGVVDGRRWYLDF